MGENKEKFNDPEMRARVSAIAEKYRLSLVLLFGSQATGKTHKQSDVDIAYFAQELLFLAEESKLVIDLMQAFRTDAVDLVSLQNASPLLRYQIASSGKVIYELMPGLFTSFFIHALRQYEEAKPLFRLRSEYLDKRITEINI